MSSPWKATAQTKLKGMLVLVRNAFLAPKWESLELGIMSLVGRSISSLIRTQGLGDLIQVFSHETQIEHDGSRTAWAP